MELDTKLINLQGILRDLMKTTGEFSRIKYKGGNEKSISQIIKAIEEYLAETFPNKDDIEHNKHLQNIVVLLIVNTKFGDNSSLLNTNEYFHLINVIPILSKCLLANLITGLKLITHYCLLMHTLPFCVNEELLNELILCLRQCEPNQNLDDTCMVLSTIIKLLSTPNPQAPFSTSFLSIPQVNIDSSLELSTARVVYSEAAIEKCGDIFSEMLKNIAGINSELIQNWKKPQIHKHMGYTLLHLLKLLRSCVLFAHNLSRITDELIQVTITIMKAVTVDVFCVWAEVKHELDQPMQTVIAGEAYLLIEHLHKYKPGQELVQMLGSIARKPKSLNEIIVEADTATMISSIDKNDDNQRLWFRAFMNTNVLQTEESQNCLNKWKHLCTEDDVIRILSLSDCTKDPAVKALVIKCAKSLSTKKLASAAARYLRECNIANLNTESVKEELTILLNITQNNSETDQNFIKNILLLLLQNPCYVLNKLYTECLKKSVHSQRLKSTWKEIQPVVTIHSFSKTALIKLFERYPPTTDNSMAYKELLDMLLELTYFKDDVLINEVFTPQMQKHFDTNDYQTLLCTLQVLNLITVKPTLYQNAISTLALLVKIMETRCNFFTFSNINQEIVQECVNFVLKYSQNSSTNLQVKDCLDQLRIECSINKFHISNLYYNQENRLLAFVYPTLNIDNHTEAVSQLIKLLQSSVTSEWILITKELESRFGYEKTLKLYTDILILLCQVTNTQLKPDNNEDTIINGLKFCLQQYGIIIKEILQPTYTSLEDKKLLTKNICSLIKSIPKVIRKEEGMRLTALISNQSLHLLRKDRDFVILLLAIEDTTISQSLAQRMLS